MRKLNGCNSNCFLTFVRAGFSHVDTTKLTLRFSETPMQEGFATVSSIVYTGALVLAE